ncbi:hypothetical protein [Pseudochryseolinea flava]|uniref:Uncharacterized protein n=1 Tax=Pseudochryseolinea flava TaxID=2059302 RepID=A0A364XYJ2_9BACT|nr:hypothetical protein [Pseudochryseolinea flava]RAV98873.1 hypothetical protein DQQ10_21465 [Pseudochryseolinea flava]
MEFNKTILASWILSGYRHIHYQAFGDYAVVSTDLLLLSTDSYLISISDLQALEMAQGIDNFKIYVLS